MYSSITLIHSQAKLHEVQRRRNVKSAHDARDSASQWRLCSAAKLRVGLHDQDDLEGVHNVMFREGHLRRQQVVILVNWTNRW